MNHCKILIDETSLEAHLSKITDGEIDLNIPVSLEKDFYNGEYFKDFIKIINEFVANGFRFNGKTLRVKSVRLDVGDTLNRHIWYYRYCEKYMLENNINNEDNIPVEIRQSFKQDAYIRAKQQKEEWFYNNLEAINILLPKDSQLSNDFKLNDGITVLYKGDDKNVKVEYLSHDYWLNHPYYKKTERALNEVYNLKDSIVKRAYSNAVDYYVERFLSRGENVQNLELFKKQSYKYLFDEGVAYCILYNESPNTIEFYLGGRETNGTQVFRGRKAQNNPIIQQYLQGPLKGADQRKFVSVKMIEED